MASRSILEEYNRGIESPHGPTPDALQAFGGLEAKAKLDEFLAFCHKDNDDLDSDAYLAAKPVYIGWGSMSAGGTPQFLTGLALRSLMLSNKKGIICGGWSDLSIKNKLLEKEKDYKALKAYVDKGNVLFIKSAPHSWLFPRCACVVHHGGAGTTAAAVLAGVPSIITPVWADQWYWGERVDSNGVGILPSYKGLLKTKPGELADCIRRCCDVEGCNEAKGMQMRAQEVGDEMALKEDGAGEAVKELEKFFREEVETGRWAEWYKGEKEKFRPKLGGRKKFCCFGG